MTLTKEEIVSAQVVLRSASGKTIGEDTVVTSENISEYVPARETVLEAYDAFSEDGFDIGEMVGVSFSISAKVRTFERVFKSHLQTTAKGGIEVVRPDGLVSPELPLHALPSSLADLMVAVVFVTPPDFGPSDFFGD